MAEEHEDQNTVAMPPEETPADSSYVKSDEGHVPVLRQLGVAAFILVFVFGTSYVPELISFFTEEDEIPDIHVNKTITGMTTVSAVDTLDPFADTDLSAKAAFVWDVRDQRVLYSKNADAQFPLASITKLMTALVAYELLADESMVNVSIEAIRADGDSGLTDGESFSLKSMTGMVLVASSNDGAQALATQAGSEIPGAVDPEKLFVHAMNLRAGELGLTQTEFKNATGLDLSETETGAVSSAHDVALLMEYLITHYPEVTKLTTADATRIYNEEGEYHDVENTNTVVDQIEGLIASKTGYTLLAGGNLVVAFETGLNRPVIAVVLGSTFNERFTDTLTLVERARQYVALKPL